jgi:hypothetical protein
MLSDMLLLSVGDLQWQIETMIGNRKFLFWKQSNLYEMVDYWKRASLHVGVATKQYTINLTRYYVRLCNVQCFKELLLCNEIYFSFLLLILCIFYSMRQEMK